MWAIRFDAKAEKELGRLSSIDRQRILKFLQQRIAPSENPRSIGDALAGSLSGFWRYRVGDYRVIVRIDDRAITVYVVRIGNRREVYR
ncbi:type II toxin-antitoxin system RelE/ParE family toxin [Mesorhizobium sp. RMAD-H1]|uniref:type II toxin-antitoxin system RelE family toxin n=1 Tax=Mesorhizobium sp. RMAD-H1 TaxID=2587065 RepID=UPI00161618C9|nr:type II toxin-antitoxin system RelE/ParE family toxin [Mesorhizobium sp. RMAD-H1]MBB2971152.1 mRNA interferase RelE/StbE [Mesorhizobium sp. RMAD-H1]